MVGIDHSADFYSQHLPKLEVLAHSPDVFSLLPMAVEQCFQLIVPEGKLLRRQECSCASPNPVLDNSHAEMNEVQGCGMELFMNGWFHCELCSQAGGTYYTSIFW